MCFVQGDQPWLDNGHYWDDFFLLKVNAKYLLEELERAYVEKPGVLKVRPSRRLIAGGCRGFVVPAAIEYDLRSMPHFCQLDAPHPAVERVLRQ